MEKVAQGKQVDEAQMPQGAASVSVHGSAGTSVSLAAPSLGSGATTSRPRPVCTNHSLNTYYATDHLGTVRFTKTIDETGTEVATSTHDYEPFGVEITPTDSCDNTHKFTGHERDLETGNDYMHFRFFSASMGRFQKPDSNFDNPIANPQGWNLYSYVKGNPVNFNDPTGHQQVEPDKTKGTLKDQPHSNDPKGDYGGTSSKQQTDAAVRKSEAAGDPTGQKLQTVLTKSTLGVKKDGNVTTITATQQETTTYLGGDYKVITTTQTTTITTDPKTDKQTSQTGPAQETTTLGKLKDYAPDAREAAADAGAGGGTSTTRELKSDMGMTREVVNNADWTNRNISGDISAKDRIGWGLIAATTTLGGGEVLAATSIAGATAGLVEIAGSAWAAYEKLDK